MRFLIDECLHESLVGVALGAGIEAGLIVIVPNLVPSVQRALFEPAIQFVGRSELINSVIEVTLDDKVVRCVQYLLPPE